MYVPPWTILAGLGALSRSELCGYLASFEETTLLNIAADRAAGIADRLTNREPGAERAFQRALAERAGQLDRSGANDAALRLWLWDRLASALGLDPSVPLSTRTANARCASVAFAAAAALPGRDNVEGREGKSRAVVAWSRLTAIVSREAPDFSAVVVAHAEDIARAVAAAARAGDLADDRREEFVRRVRDRIEALPSKVRTQAMDDALKSGDRALVALIASGTSLVGAGVAVQVAGFGAYILAAQASAVIPFVTGPALVSLLFVIANPLFAAPALLGGAYVAGRYVKGSAAKALASAMTLQLALKGVEVGRTGLQTAIDGFRELTDEELPSLSGGRRKEVLSKLAKVRALVGPSLPRMPGEPEGKMALPVAHVEAGGLSRILFQRDESAADAAVVGGFTVGDVLFDAVAIDPLVLSAADFSQTEDLSGVLGFSGFADRVSGMSADAAAGAESSLRGYVAEQVVAACLVEHGHVVSFPSSSNHPGSDLLVDGAPFQVKCLTDLGGLRQHFETYPDIPVIANSELAAALADAPVEWADNVFFLDGFSREVADLMTRTALDAGASLEDLDVPIFAIAVSGARNLFGWWSGRTPLSDLPFSIVLDGAVKGGLSAVGGMSGKIAGLLLFGPAGALVLGGVGGASALLGSAWVREQATKALSDGWVEEVEGCTDRLKSAIVATIERKIRLLNEKEAAIASQEHPQGGWFSARLQDDVVGLAEQLWELEADTARSSQPGRARACLAVMSEAAVHPSAVQDELSILLSVLREQPNLARAVSDKASLLWTTLRTRTSGRS
ncbi:hypothetical protein [Aureimonas sp. SK2]|uniref:hypothetical protein n=1 Tax=Aureimonas sp. SK2 TaxID=3015992 RepID=UPI00244448A5|nr:hypothetical protein [Aureimonas sp. SK2]